MTVTLNDKPLQLPDGATLADALTAAGVETQGTATALDGAVVPLAQRATTPLADGSSILVIKAFYGG